MSKKMGRPTKAQVERKTCLIIVRVTADELKNIDVAAERENLNRSAWIRKTLTLAAGAIQ